MDPVSSALTPRIVRLLKWSPMIRWPEYISRPPYTRTFVDLGTMETISPGKNLGLQHSGSDCVGSPCIDEICEPNLDDRLVVGLDTFFSYWECWQVTLTEE